MKAAIYYADDETKKEYGKRLASYKAQETLAGIALRPVKNYN